MNRSQFIAFVRDVHAHPEKLAYYRKKYKNVYPFSDGIFKMLMANEAKHERTIKFLNAMLGLYKRTPICITRNSFATATFFTTNSTFT
ncbi:hypothetical protein [uncultured Fibrobacter sp.]|uniref:hypothetical protein n=1 Tax=uncultured Fibrobacter sp. TaxID=261512 RepID=UPI0025D605B8|nr:hypothetical protein [uncultured Fibrobacter sp.]